MMSVQRMRVWSFAVAVAGLTWVAGPWVAYGASGRVPGRPDIDRTNAIGSRQIDVTWHLLSGVAHYRIYVEGQLAGRSELGFFSIVGLDPDEEYELEVSAVDSAGVEGARSNGKEEETDNDDSNIDGTAPLIPLAVGATARPGEIQVDWLPSVDLESGVSEYRLFRDGILIARPTSTRFVDGGRLPGATHTYRVAAVNGSGKTSGVSAPATATVPAAGDSTPPSIPQGVAATSSRPDRATVTWSASSDPESGVAGYNIYRNGSLLTSTTGTQLQDVGLDPNTLYTYEISAVNGDGLESARSAPASVTTRPPADTSPPSTPADLTAHPLDSARIELGWSAAIDPESGVTHYNVYRDGTRVAGSTSTSFVDTGLSGSTTYAYRVAAVNGEGLEGQRSAQASATTPAAVDRIPPAAPGRLRVMAIGN